MRRNHIWLARISDDELARFIQIVKDLNRNSYYGCMPTISVREISNDDLILYEGDEEHCIIIPFEDADKYEQWVSEYPLYLDGQKYLLRSGTFNSSKVIV